MESCGKCVKWDRERWFKEVRTCTPLSLIHCLSGPLSVAENIFEPCENDHSIFELFAADREQNYFSLLQGLQKLGTRKASALAIYVIPSPFFLLWNTKLESLKKVHTALSHTTTVKSDRNTSFNIQLFL